MCRLQGSSRGARKAGAVARREERRCTETRVHPGQAHRPSDRHRARDTLESQLRRPPAARIYLSPQLAFQGLHLRPPRHVQRLAAAAAEPGPEPGPEPRLRNLGAEGSSPHTGAPADGCARSHDTHIRGSGPRPHSGAALPGRLRASPGASTTPRGGERLRLIPRGPGRRGCRGGGTGPARRGYVHAVRARREDGGPGLSAEAPQGLPAGSAPQALPRRLSPGGCSSCTSPAGPPAPLPTGGSLAHAPVPSPRRRRGRKSLFRNFRPGTAGWAGPRAPREFCFRVAGDAGPAGASC